jgi:hypothetical protein
METPVRIIEGSDLPVHNSAIGQLVQRFDQMRILRVERLLSPGVQIDFVPGFHR